MRTRFALALTTAALSGLALSPRAHAGEEDPGGSVLYVDDDGSPEGNGLSWDTALPSLQDALDAAESSAGQFTEIRVAGGTYVPDRGFALPLGDRASTFFLRAGLILRGGYAGAGHATPDLRDPATFPSVLSGDLLGNDEPGFSGTADNAYHVVTIDRLAIPAVLDGFTVRGGRADGFDSPIPPEARDRGAGISIYDTQPQIVNCIIENNWSANHGAVTDYGRAVFVDCVIRNNHAAQFAGGMYVDVTADTQIISCRFENNTTPGQGGGLYVKGTADVVMSTFVNNVSQRGGGIYGAPESTILVNGGYFEGNEAEFEGGGVFSDFAHVTYLDATFVGNRAPEGDGGGGIWNKGQAPVIDGCIFMGNDGLAGALYNLEACPTVRNCTFINNTATLTGAALWNQGCAPLIENCHFENNVSVTGGALYNEESEPVMLNCTFVNNAALGGDGGGAVANAFGTRGLIDGCTFTDNRADNGLFGGGGAIVNYVSSPIIQNCTFTRNLADLGGGAIYSELEAGRRGEFYNCFFFGNRAGEGGGVMSFRACPRFIGCVFVGNSLTGKWTDLGGAALNHYEADASYENCTIVGNTAPAGAGMMNLIGTPTVVNSIVWGNDGAAIEGDPAVVRFSDIEGGAAGDGNLDAAPLFVRMPDAGPDATWGTPDDDYGDLRLAPGSPCIDAGHSGDVALDAGDLDGDGIVAEYMPFDAAGQPRVTNGAATDAGCGATVVDLGAYEAPGPAAAFGAPGDLDGSGAVDIGDLVQLLSMWGPCTEACCLGDLNRNGAVDFADLVQMLGAW